MSLPRAAHLRRIMLVLFILGALALAFMAAGPSGAQRLKTAAPRATVSYHHGRITTADRMAAAKRLAAALAAAPSAAGKAAVIGPNSTPDYFGTTPNYANSPLPHGPIGAIKVLSGGHGYIGAVSVTIADISWGAGSGARAKATVVHGVIKSITVTKPGAKYTDPVVTITGNGSGAQAMAMLNDAKLSGGIRKFVDALPGLGRAGINDLGQYIPVAVPDTSTFPGSDYYEIALVQYKEKFSKDLPATTVRGYVQIERRPTRCRASTSPSPTRTAASSKMLRATRCTPWTRRSTWVPASWPSGAGPCASSGPYLPTGTPATCSCRWTPPSWAPARAPTARCTQTDRGELPPPRRRHPLDQRRHAPPVDHAGARRPRRTRAA